MNDSKEVDYDLKILNFMAMTETGNPDTASKYLESANWDESKAVNLFFNSMKVNNNSNKNNNNNFNEKTLLNKKNNNKLNEKGKKIIDTKKKEINNKNNINYSDNILNENLISVNDNNNINNINEVEDNNDNQDINCLSKYILNPMKHFCCFCCNKKVIVLNEEKDIFQLLPNKANNFIEFKQSIKNKVGIIILYTSKNIPFLNGFINQISKNTLSINLIKQNCYIFPLLATSDEGIKIQKIISNNQLIYPIFAFCFNSNITLQRKNILNKLEGESISLEVFHSTLIDSSEKLNNILKKNKNDNENKNFENNFNTLTDGEILLQQKLDMEELEKQVQKQEEELKNQKIIEQQKKQEEELKKKEEEKKLIEAKKKIVDEPSEDDPNATTISFRYPDGEKRKDRRFLKSHTIQNLYDFISSLGREIYTEDEYNKFSLYQPFPPKKYEEMNNTLEKEGLFPNAIIQIREE